MLFLPAGFGGAGLLCSLIWLRKIVPLTGIIIYWAFYFLSMWLIWLVVNQIKQFVQKKVGK